MATHGTSIEARKARLEEFRALGKRISAERYGTGIATAIRSAETVASAGNAEEEKRRAEFRAAARAAHARRYGR
ncbi:hypothetical protein [Hyphomicrobium sp. CS1GBMeth3]|uniref:hypothetical protein n=1 Tax=Hyphomicrobium sp. CS1GBMeth3 TaxID=1892845 RepID=UPI0009318FEB|nr:hypothetical protein [Hyphomicrobium sp. CS1GBMeth3]